MLVCAGLLHFNCCVSCTTMSICSLYTMRASTFQLPACGHPYSHQSFVVQNTFSVRYNKPM